MTDEIFSEFNVQADRLYNLLLIFILVLNWYWLN